MKIYKNLVAVHKKVISPSLCKKTIKFFEDNPDFDSNIAVDEGGVIEKEIRNSKEIILYWADPKYKEIGEELNSKIRPLVDDYFKEFSELFTYAGNTTYEDAHLLKYKPNEGFYNFHWDTGGKNIDNRLLSIIIYLNDVKEGGETEFKYIDVDPIKPSKGDVVLFPSGVTHMHKGNMPISNNKYICVFWLIAL
jgi:hypothetical protein